MERHSELRLEESLQVLWTPGSRTTSVHVQLALITPLVFSRRESQMALNAASHNIPGEPTGPATDPPPAPDDATKSAILGATENDPVGQNMPGRDGGGPVGDKETNFAVCAEPGTKPDYVKSRVPGVSNDKDGTSSHPAESCSG